MCEEGLGVLMRCLCGGVCVGRREVGILIAGVLSLVEIIITIVGCMGLV